nr:MAG TPA: tail collar fiber protein [Caudoviricetes sp.]
MAVFKDTTITDNGRTLIADALANNKQITFTRMITSSKSYEDSTDVSKLISVDEIKQSVNMTRINQEGTKVRLNAIFTNSAVNTSYKIQTIGLYAKTGTGNEILYSVTRAKEPDTMPATNGINLATVEIDLITEINNSNGATMLMNPSSLVTTSSLVAELEKLIGMEFGGNIQDTGNKVKGKFYYDSVTKFYYECIENTNLTYNDATKFRAISNKPISDRVGNLYKTKILKNSQIDSRIMSYFKDCYLIKQGNIAVFSGYLDPQFDRSINTVGKVLFRLPFAPISESWARPAFTLKTTGDVEAGYLNVFASNKITEPIHVNFSYICESEN